MTNENVSYPIELKTQKQKKVFKYFVERFDEDVGKSTSINHEAIASYAVLFLEIAEMKAYLKKHGTTYESESDRGGIAIKQRPEVAILDRMEARLFQMKKQLGFYHNENGKSGKKLDELEEFLRG